MPNDIIKQTQLAYNQLVAKGWFKARQKAIDYYNGDVDGYTNEWLSETIKLNVPLPNNNITKRIIERISLFYYVIWH